MGIDIHVRIVKKNHETNTWEHIKLYKKYNKKFKRVDIYPFRDYELFDILTFDKGFSPHSIVIQDLPFSLRQEIKRCQNTFGYYNFKEINLADLKLYLNKKPKIRDYDNDEDPTALKDNPVKFFIEKIEQYIDFADPFWDLDGTSASDIKILYWFDR